MFFNKKLFNFVLKLGIHVVKKERGCLKNFNNFILGQKKGTYVVNIDYTLLTTYQIFLFMYRLSKNNGKFLFIERMDKFKEIFESISSSTSQRYIEEEFWVEGTLTNFTRLKWEHLLKGVNIGDRLPDTIVIFDNSWFDNILVEVSRVKLPLLGTLKFSDQDKFLSYYILGGFKDYDAVYFFCKIINLAIIGSKSLKLKYLSPKGDFRKLRRKPRRRRKLLKKMKWARLFRKNVANMPKFRGRVKHFLRRYQLIRNVFQRYYDSKKIIRDRWHFAKVKRKVSKKLGLPTKKIGSVTQMFVAKYETRLSSILYRLGVCKNINVAKRLIFSKNVYVNNTPIFHKNFFVKPGDVIQLNLQKCRSFQLVSFLKRTRKLRKKVPFKWRRKIRLFTKRKKKANLRGLLKKIPLKDSTIASRSSKKYNLRNQSKYPTPFNEFYRETFQSTLWKFYKKENIANVLNLVIGTYQGNRAYFSQMSAWETLNWLYILRQHNQGQVTQIFSNKVWSTSIQDILKGTQPQIEYSTNFKAFPYTTFTTRDSSAGALISAICKLKYIQSMYQEFFFSTLQEKNINNSKKIIKHLFKNAKIAGLNNFKTTKALYKNKVRRLKSKKKTLRKSRSFRQAFRQTAHKFFRKRHGKSWNVSYAKSLKFFSKWQKRVPFDLENWTSFYPIEKKPKKLKRVPRLLKRWVIRFGRKKRKQLIDARRGLSFKKPKVKQKKIVKVRGKPWWFNREKWLRLKFFSWKKQLVGQRQDLTVSKGKNKLLFFNWVFKRKQTMVKSRKLNYFKRMVFAYRAFQSYENITNESNSIEEDSIEDLEEDINVKIDNWGLYKPTIFLRKKRKKFTKKIRKKRDKLEKKLKKKIEKRKRRRRNKMKNKEETLQNHTKNKTKKKTKTIHMSFVEKKIKKLKGVALLRMRKKNMRRLKKKKSRKIKRVKKFGKLLKFKRRKLVAGPLVISERKLPHQTTQKVLEQLQVMKKNRTLVNQRWLRRKRLRLKKRRRYGHYGLKRKLLKWKLRKWRANKKRKKKKKRRWRRKKKKIPLKKKLQWKNKFRSRQRRDRWKKRFVWWRIRKRLKHFRWKNGSPYQGPLLKAIKSYPRNFLFNRKYCVGVYLYTPNTKKIPLHSQMLTLKRLKLLANS